MSQYSLMVGSFIRTGNYPMEANYIFATYEDLVNFYSDELQKATLHKGLLRIVEDDDNGKQALYWVTKKQTNDELEFTKLISGGDISDITSNIEELISDINERLEKEIEERKSEDTALWGTDDKTQIPDDLNSILDLANALVAFKEAYEESLLQIDDGMANMFTILKAIAGSPSDKILTYLGTLDFQNLTEISKALHKFLETKDPKDEKVNTLLELLDFLEGFTNDDTLKGIINDLREELWGDPTPNTQFRTMRGIQDFVEALASATRNRDDNLQSELDQTQVGVGLSGDGSYNADSETYYLKNATSVMNALKILDSLINEAINNCNLEVEDTNTIDLSIDKYREKTVLTANVLVSKNEGNGIIARADGIYHKVTSEYNNGVLTLKVNDNIVAQHVLGLAFVGIKRAYYDPTTESIVMEFKKEDGTTEELRIPVTQLIREWTVDNSGVSDVVVLTKVEDFEGGPDKLSADIRIFADKYNILTKEGNTLYVKGTADNIVWNDVKVSVILDTLTSELSSLESTVATGLNDVDSKIVALSSDLQEQISNEIVRAKLAELEIKTEFDASQKIQDTKIDALQTQADKNSESYTELAKKFNQEIVDRTNEDTKLAGLIATERTRALAKEEVLEESINNLKTSQENTEDALQTEINRAKAAELSNQEAISDERLRATTKEAELESIINGEIDRSKREDDSLSERIFVLNNELVKAVDRSEKAIEKALEVESNYVKVDNKIDNETTRAKAAEQVLEHSISDETTRAILIEQQLRDKINSNKESLDSLGEDIDALRTSNSELSDKLDQEIERATNKELELSDKIDELESKTIEVSSKEGNIITLESDGIFAEVGLSYDATTNVLTFSKSGAEPIQLLLVSNSLVDSVTYDKVRESLVISYTVNGTKMPDIVVPVRDLINEWTTKNTSTITLTREIHEGSEPDVLSAEVNISSSDNNILEEKKDGLFVSGEAITKNAEDIAELKEKMSDLDGLNNKLENEITRATTQEQILEQKIENEQTRAEAKEDILEQKIENEVSRATTEETTLKERIETYINQVATMQSDIETLKEEKADKSMLLWQNAEATPDAPDDPEETTDKDWYDGD